MTGDSNTRSIWLCSRNNAVGNIAVMLAAWGVVATAAGWPDILVAGFVAGLNVSTAVHLLRHALAPLRSVHDLNSADRWRLTAHTQHARLTLEYV